MTHLISPSYLKSFLHLPSAFLDLLVFSYILVIPSRFYYLIPLPLSDFTVLEWFYAQYFSTPPSFSTPLVSSASFKVLRMMCMHVWLSCVWLFVTPWSVACQGPLFMEFSRQEYWSGLPFPSPEDLPDSGIEPWSPELQQILYHLSHQGSLHLVGNSFSSWKGSLDVEYFLLPWKLE